MGAATIAGRREWTRAGTASVVSSPGRRNPELVVHPAAWGYDGEPYDWHRQGDDVPQHGPPHGSPFNGWFDSLGEECPGWLL